MNDVDRRGAIDNIGVQLDASYGLLVHLLPNHPFDAERRPLKQRKAMRVRRRRSAKRSIAEPEGCSSWHT